MVLGRLVKCSRTDLANACSVAAEVAWRTRRVVRRVSKGRGGNMEVWFWNFLDLQKLTFNFCTFAKCEKQILLQQKETMVPGRVVYFFLCFAWRTPTQLLVGIAG